MPLAFESQSHGTIAFGFFNIETDMLLLQDLFFFADRFCEAVGGLADAARAAPEAVQELSFDGWRIRDRAAVGDLHGAIGGVDLSGFIGATYREWPFPAEPEAFKQNPDGRQTQALVTRLVEPFGLPERITLRWAPSRGEARVAEYAFDRPGFRELLGYVARGGYPRWTDDRRPGYVQRMLARVEPLGPAAAR